MQVGRRVFDQTVAFHTAGGGVSQYADQTSHGAKKQVNKEAIGKAWEGFGAATRLTTQENVTKPMLPGQKRNFVDRVMEEQECSQATAHKHCPAHVVVGARAEDLCGTCEVLVGLLGRCIWEAIQLLPERERFICFGFF